MGKTISIFLIFFATSSYYGKVVQYTFNQQCRKATEIFTARVISLSIIKESKSEYGHFKTYKIKFVTSKIWKGTVTDTMICIASEAFCSPNIFSMGQTYLVYATRCEINLGSGRSENITFRHIKEDIRKLNVRYLFRRPQKEVNDRDRS